MQKAPAVELRNVTKYFGSVRANEGVNLTVDKGTIHAIVGENGAGKSTALKILFGLYSPTSGEIFLHGKKVEWKSPADAVKAGIGMVHQHFMLSQRETVIDNILLAAAKHQSFFSIFSVLNRKKAKEKLQILANNYGMTLPWDSAVEDLSVGEQQRVEILKLLFLDSDILILDEPTAVLTPQEIEELTENLRRLKNEGKTILIITHKLKEVMAMSDKVTVMRQGRVVATSNTSDTNAAELAAQMMGEKVDLSLTTERKAFINADTILDVKMNSRIQFKLSAGEILGIAGVEGNGQLDLLHYLTKGRPQGMGHVPENRLKQAVISDLSIEDNFLIGLQKSDNFFNRGILNRKKLNSFSREQIAEFDIRPPQEQLPLGSLSGGNQQKMVIARELAFVEKTLVAAHPTRGVDVGAIHFIHTRLLEARNKGVGILLVSSELEELFALSDRILVMFGGTFMGEFTRDQFDEKAIGLCMGGIQKTTGAKL